MRTYKSVFDRLGILASLLCLVHCVLLPLFWSTLSLWDIALLENVWIEGATILISFFAGGWAIRSGYKWHHKKWVFLLFAGGLGLLIAGNFARIEPAEILLKSSGAMIVIYAHIANWRFARACVPAKKGYLLS